MIRKTGVLLGSVLLAAGCTQVFSATNLLDDYQSQKVEIQPVSAKPYLDFSFSLFEKLEDQPNLMFSPLSLYMALAMTENGAKEQTLTQMEDVLGLDAKQLNDFLYSMQEQIDEDESLRSANSIWFNDVDDLHVLPEYLQTIKNYYQAEIYQLEFDEKTKDEINLWVSEKTDGIIKELIDQVDSDAMIYLLNALSFEEDWLVPYDEIQISQDIFTNEDGSESEAEYMNSQEAFYLEDEHFTGFSKLYDNERYSFAALLPKTSLKEDLPYLNADSFEKLYGNQESKTVFASLPKFELEWEMEMKDVFEALGMSDAFDPDHADFSAMATCDQGNLLINRILHKASLSVFEQGTKAGAASAIEMIAETALEIEEPKEVRLNRPFVVALMDRELNVPLFMGIVTDLNG